MTQLESIVITWDGKLVSWREFELTAIVRKILVDDGAMTVREAGAHVLTCHRCMDATVAMVRTAWRRMHP